MIRDNLIKNCKGGIRVSGKHHLIQHNTIIDSRGYGINLIYGMGDELKTFYQSVSDCIITENHIINSNKSGILIGGDKNKDWSQRAMAKNPQKYGVKVIQSMAPYNNVIADNRIENPNSTDIQNEVTDSNTNQ